MNQSDNSDRTVKILYRILLIELVLAVVIGVLLSLNGPLIGNFSLLEFAIIVIGLVVLVVARWVLRPRVTRDCQRWNPVTTGPTRALGPLYN